MFCSVDTCTRLKRTNGFCQAHDKRHKRNFKGILDSPLKAYGIGAPFEQNGYLKVMEHGKIVRVHGQIMEAHLGRKLHRAEVVHHVDGNTRNNDVSNLKVFKSNGDHMKDHHGRSL